MQDDLAISEDERNIDNNKHIIAATYITDTHIQCIHAHIQLYFSTSMLAVYIYSGPRLLLQISSYCIAFTHAQLSTRAHLATSCCLQLL